MGSTPFVEKLAPVSIAARFEAGVFSQRNLLAGAPLLAALLLAPAPLGASRFGAALALAGVGAALRAWCTVFNRYAQGERKTLATSGPYAVLRNPIYAANSLVLVGAALTSGASWLPLVTLAWALLVYDLTVRHEERRLRDKYGDAYAAYCAQVARWRPSLRAAALEPLPTALLPALLRQSRVLLVLAPFAARAWYPHF